jgi:hypothetical protein
VSTRPPNPLDPGVSGIIPNELLGCQGLEPRDST